MHGMEKAAPQKHDVHYTLAFQNTVTQKIDAVCNALEYRSIHKKLICILSNKAIMDLIYLLDNDLHHGDSATDRHLFFLSTRLQQ